MNGGDGFNVDPSRQKSKRHSHCNVSIFVPSHLFPPSSALPFLPTTRSQVCGVGGSGGVREHARPIR